MNQPQTSTIECPYRKPVGDASDSNIALCGLLQEVVGAQDTELYHLRSDACHACTRWFRPSVTNLNPVVASLVYNLASHILTQGGLPGCDLDQAKRLYELASENIPSEQDCVPVADETECQSNLECPQLDVLIPRPRRRSGPRVSHWAVGVTTAPRGQSTLEACLASMAAAGWNEVRLFVDGDVQIPGAWSHLPTSCRTPQVGAWPSYYLALAELVMRQPHADAYMLVQDDVVFFQHPLLRGYLETVFWPGNRPGLVSLFCSRAFSRPISGWYEIKDAWVWGAQANIFSRAAALAFLSDSDVVRHRLADGHEGLAKIDFRIGEWALRTSTPVHVPTPSLVQHVGHVSALWPNVRVFGDRRANQFAGRQPKGDLEQ